MQQPHARSRYTAPLILLVATIAVIVGINMPTAPRFEYVPLNYAVVFIVTIMLPASLFWLAWKIPLIGWRILAGVAVALFSTPFLFFSLLVFGSLQSVASEGVDASFEPIGELRRGHATYRLYRINNGATTNWAIRLRKEYALIPGVNLVTDIEQFEPFHDATIQATPAGGISITLQPLDRGGKVRTADVKPYAPPPPPPEPPPRW